MIWKAQVLRKQVALMLAWKNQGCLGCRWGVPGALTLFQGRKGSSEVQGRLALSAPQGNTGTSMEIIGRQA